jgi:hypothetical protein
VFHPSRYRGSCPLIVGKTSCGSSCPDDTPENQVRDKDIFIYVTLEDGLTYESANCGAN